MSDSSMTPLQSDEALHAFMDGELNLSNEQSLFDELAASPELRTEMKDALSIRSAVFQDIKSPPDNGEAALLAGLGFTSGGAAAGTSLAAIGAVSSASVYPGIAAVATAIGSAGAGFILAWLLLAGPNTNNIDVASGNSAAAVNGAGGSEVVAGRVTEPKSDAPPVVRVDTVYAIKLVPVVSENRAPQMIEPVEEIDNTTIVKPAVQPTSIAVTSAQYRSPSATSLAPPASMGSDLRTAQYYATDKGSNQMVFRLRTLASGLQSNEPTPESVQNAFLPNSAFALMVPIASGHEVGVELGSESFRQVFQVDEVGKTVEYTQTPVLFWIGATYQWMPLEFDFIPGMSPFINLTAGYVDSQGPIGRGTLGLSYQPFGPLRFTAGIDASALIYTHNNNSFTSTKWGLSYGISFDLGSIR